MTCVICKHGHTRASTTRVALERGDTATNQATNVNIDLTFNEPVNVSGNWFQIVCTTSPTRNVADTVVTGGPGTWTINPNVDFTTAETCTVTVVATQVTDVDLNDPPDNMLANHVFSFTMEAAPAVQATNPADTATTATTTQNVTITFSEPVNVTGNWFTLVCATSGTRNANVPGEIVITGGPTTFTADPVADFAAGELCTLTVVATQVTDQDAIDPPDAMLANAVITFTLDAAPSVTTTVPVNGGVGAPSADIVVNFSETVNVTTNAFTIECPTGSGAIAYTLTPAAPGGVNSFTLDPTTDLPSGTVCTVTVVALQVTDTDTADPPDAMSANHVFSFTVDAAPVVQTTTPANSATNQVTNTNLTITFSEPVNVAGNWFQIVCGVSGTRNVADTVVTGGPTTFTINPNTDFTQAELCTVTVFAAQVTDQDANDPPDNMTANYVFSFTMDAAPAVSNTTPTDSATNQVSNTDLTITFSEPVTPAGNWFQIVCGSSGTRNVADTVVTGGPTTFTVNPNTDFTQAELCTVTVFAAQVTDQDANDPPDNMTVNHVFSFTLDAAPSVTTTTPTNSALGAATNTNITINFNEPVNATTSSFTITCPGAQTFAVSGSGTSTITLNPNADLPEDVTCTVTVIATQVTDVDSNDPPDNLAADHVFSFTTDASPVVIATTPTDGATNQASNTNLTITFSEPVNVAGNWFQIVCGTSGTRNVADTGVTGGPTTFTVNPNTNFAGGESCTTTVFAAQVTDVDANDPPNNMTANHVFSFTMDAAPTVSSTTPTAGATGVPTNTNITLNFSESVNIAAGGLTINCGAAVAFSPALPQNGVSSIVLDPTADLPAGSLCTVTGVAANISDVDANDPPNLLDGNADGTEGDNFVLTFTTDVAPSVTTTTPTNGATQVAANTNVVVNFNENVNVTGNAAFTLECPVASPQAYTLTPAAPGGTNSFTLDPTADLPFGTTCTVTVVATQVTDTDGNDPPDNMAANFVFSFTIDAAPTVTATTPTNGATSVAKNTNVTLTFNEPVNVAGNWFQIVCGGQTQTTADTVVTGGPTTWTINPNADLLPGNIRQVTVFAAQVTDQDSGDPPDNMAANHVFSFSVPPEAVADNYKDADGDPDADPTVVGNVGVNTDTSTEFSILTNDATGPGVTVNLPGGGATTAGGSIVVAVSGKFMYVPPAGFEGVDTFAYNISNAAGTSASVNVTMTVSGMLWFINIAAGAGDGRLSTPFNSAASFQAVNNGAGTNPAAGDNIFMYENASSYAGPITLLTNQKLIGQDATATLAAISGVSVPPDSIALPAMNTGAPATTLNNSTGGSNAVNLNAVGTSNTIRGLTLTTGTNTSKGINGSTFGTLTVADLIIIGNGPALDLTTGTLAGSFNSITSSGGANGIRLSAINSGSTISFGTGALSGATADEFLITGTNSTIALTYDGTISTGVAAAKPVNISGKTTAGSVTFNGAVSSTGSGVNLDNNDGATITFRGGLALSTGANTAFNAINGGTIEVCDENLCNPAATGALVNTLTTTTGTALNVANTTISANNLEFQSIASNGSASGIVLNTTGSLGGLNVKGDSGSTNNSSGGTIQNTTGFGVDLFSTMNVSFDQLNVQTTAFSGINGREVTNFTFTNGTINNCGNGASNFDDNISFNANRTAGTLQGNNLSGTLTVTNSVLNNAFGSGIHVEGKDGTVTNAVITGNSFTSPTSAATSKGTGINLVGTGTATTAARLTKATLSGNTISNFPGGSGIQVNYGNTDAGGPRAEAGIPNDATNIVTITNNTIQGQSAANRMNVSAILFVISGRNSAQRGRANVLIQCNGKTTGGCTATGPLTNVTGTVIGVGINANADLTGVVDNNVIVANHQVAGLASNGIGGGNGVSVGCAAGSCESPDSTVTITNNNVSQTDGNGILFVARGNTGNAKFGIRNNTVAAPLSGVRPGIRIDAGNGAAGEVENVCLDISGNTSAGSGVSQGIGLRKESASTFGIEGLAPSPAAGPQMEAHVAGQNPAGNGVLNISTSGGDGTNPDVTNWL